MPTSPDLDADAAEERIAARRASVPALTYPEELPVSQAREELLTAIRDNQVVIVAGETGSGKTTQLPKICLELGRGVHGTIGHTQPRRLAARTVSERLSDELGTERGGTVGYKIRFTERLHEGTLVKLMTDGILLAEIQHDRRLLRYDTLIIDEAHERSLNVDFLLGYLKRLLPKRPDLKVIITSATIDPERFSEHFGGAPIVSVSGRTYPVEVRYRPNETDLDQSQAICAAVRELAAEGPGDVLVFASGEREIRDTADALEKEQLRNTEVLPLYARLSAAEQHRVFQSHTGRRIVLATNIAETSLTVPGIRYVVDPGTARISRYSQRTKVQRLPIEPISRASADQRKGRCGRLADGICIRLYSEEDFLNRPQFTDPEIVRTNLASVILQMAVIGLGDIGAFPFIDPPDRRSVKAGVQLLQELGAFDPAVKNPRKRLTQVGRKLARFPIDPRLARMVLEADENGCVHELLIIAAALSIQDPRERPADHQQAATEKHARFSEPESDFATYLKLWDYLREQQKALSTNQFRKLCRTEFINYLRVREWQDVHGQLRKIATGLGLSSTSTRAGGERIHKSLLAGLLSHIGMRDPETRTYVGARNTRFAVFPGSALFKKQPQWLMAAELVETSRLWGRTNAKIDPSWIEPLAEHLVRRSYSEPHWEKKQGAVLAYEKVTLYGVPIVASRKVNYARIDPALSRELFIRHALVEGDWETRHAFFHQNRELLDEVEDLEHRVRRRDILVDDTALFDFYDQRIGKEVVSARHFDSWWKRVKRKDPDLLTFEKSMLVNADADEVSTTDYPDRWQQGELSLPLTYQFEPGDAADGVTVHIPLVSLNQVDASDFGWQVPGLRHDLVTALIRSLPKQLRRSFVPAPDHARAALERVAARQEPLLFTLERELSRTTGVFVPRDAWDFTKVPDHLTMTFRVHDDGDRTLAEGKDLETLRRSLQEPTRDAISAVGRDIERTGLRSWNFGALPQVVEDERAGRNVRAYPTLVDEGSSVSVGMVETEGEQQRSGWRGTRRLLLLAAPSPLGYVQRQLASNEKLALGHNPHGRVQGLLDDCVNCAADKLMAEHGAPVWDQAAFDQLYEHVRAGLADTTLDTVRRVVPVLTNAYRAEQQLTAVSGVAPAATVADIRSQLSGLVFPGFVAAIGWRRLPDLQRYLRAAERRLEKLTDDSQRDADRMESIRYVQGAYEELLEALPADRAATERVREIRWMIEELRVSYFAQRLGTAYPVSEKRVLRAIDDVW